MVYVNGVEVENSRKARGKAGEGKGRLLTGGKIFLLECANLVVRRLEQPSHLVS